jgi:flagellar FliL protein
MAEEISSEESAEAAVAAAAAASGGPTPEEEALALEAEKKKKKTKLILIIVAVVVVLAAAGGYVYTKKNEEAAKLAEEEAKKPENILKKQLAERKANATPIYIPMDEIVVNLPGRGGEHYLQTKIVLRTSDSSTEGKIKDFLPLIRDKVITVLSSRQMQELATVEGKTMLSKEVALVINSIISPQLTAIYVLQQQPSTADIQNLERLNVVPKETSTGQKISLEAANAAAAFWNITEMDLPVQAVLFSTFVMQ